MNHLKPWFVILPPENIKDFFRIKGPKSIYFYSIIIGVVSGLGAVGFAAGLAWGEHLTYDLLMGLERTHVKGELHIGGHPSIPVQPLVILFLPAIGGLLVGLFTHTIAPEAKGNGTDSMIYAFHHNEGRVRGLNSLFKVIATIITLSTGGSGGKEGPTAQIGSSFGSTVAGLLQTGARARRTLLLAGTAGGLGAIFRAPFGGALTAVEVVYQEDMEADALVPAIISSVTAYLVYSSIMGQGALFDLEDVGFQDYRHLLIYIILGLTATAGGFLFTRIYHALATLKEKLPLHPVFHPALGGLGVGIIGVFFPEAIGTGFGILQEVLDGGPPLKIGNEGPYYLIATFLILALLKMVTTSLTIALGGSAGVFGPSLFIGGMLGGFTASIAAIVFPDWNISATSFILVGMASFFSGVANAPIAGMIMVSDMVGNYALLPALMPVSIIAVALSTGWSIYRGQARTRFQSPAHYWDMKLDILDRMRIADHFQSFRQVAMVESDTLLADLDNRLTDQQATDFVVYDTEKKYRGIISLRKVRLSEELMVLRNLIQVNDAADSSIPAVTPDDHLGEALRIIMEHEVDKVAVLQGTTVAGYLRYTDVLNRYYRAVQRKE